MITVLWIMGTLILSSYLDYFNLNYWDDNWRNEICAFTVGSVILALLHGCAPTA
jgi:hypothetical protein